MLAFRIARAIYADRLVASGRAARWNSSDHMVIYAAANRALACLENLVHLVGEPVVVPYRTILIEWPDDLAVTTIALTDLPSDWQSLPTNERFQQMGDDWSRGQKTAVLQVPSAIIPHETNYLLNTLHPDFQRITLVGTENFQFDRRLLDALQVSPNPRG